MSDKSVTSSKQEGSPPSKSLKSCWVRCMSPLIFCLVLGITITSLLLYYRPWQIQTHFSEDIDTLKNVTVALSDRVNRLEASEKTVSTPLNTEQISNIENRLTTLQHNIETLQTQQTTGDMPGQLEKSQAFEKDLNHLAEAQKTIKATLTFWRLKKKVLSDAPYTMELIAYKALSKPDETLALLEKYADKGLQTLKTSPEEPTLISSENETPSWWSRFKAAAGSLVKIEKVSTPVVQPVSTNQDRQTIEDLLARIDQTLAQQLDSPLPGDALK